jgi:hypothetical protein
MEVSISGAEKLREAWLTKAMKGHLSDMLADYGMPVPECRVSVGFPSQHARGQQAALGEVWPAEPTQDGVPQVFVSPLMDSPIEVSTVLLHELLHIAFSDCGHRGPFRAAALTLGFVTPLGKPMAGLGLKSRLNRIAVRLGPYPHSSLKPLEGEKQGSRLRLYMCECPVKVRVASDLLRAQCLDCGGLFRRQA